MALYEVFSYSLRVRYKTSLCSKTTLFYLLTTILTLLLPILLIYMQGFWRTVDYFREQPDVSFKHKMLLLLETRELDHLIFWSTYTKLNELVPHEMQEVVPTIEHREEDYNRDGRYDELLMTIDIPTHRQEIVSIKLLLMFDYRLYLYTKLWMECAAYVHYSSALPGSSFHLLGDLYLNQKEPLSSSGTDTRYNISVIEESKRDASFLKLEKVFTEYMKRNVSASLTNVYPVWKSGNAETFVMTLTVKYPEQTILYKVPLWQLIKYFFVQYVAFFIVLSFIFYKIKLYIFKKQIVPSIVISPIKKD